MAKKVIVIALSHPDQLAIVRKTYKETTGKDLKNFDWKGSPIDIRFMQANGIDKPIIAKKIIRKRPSLNCGAFFVRYHFIFFTNMLTSSIIRSLSFLIVFSCDSVNLGLFFSFNSSLIFFTNSLFFK